MLRPDHDDQKGEKCPLLHLIQNVLLLLLMYPMKNGMIGTGS
jgi:hypothetical protein